ncbi:MAG: hypothetical protein ACOVMQ_12420 [Cyclobacteriaceae bacterium]|jgi:hypothetical protein
MKTIDIRERLHHYIETAQTKKVKAVYAMVEDEIEEVQDYWNDPKFLSELNRRRENYLSGKSKVYSLEEAMNQIKQN